LLFFTLKQVNRGLCQGDEKNKKDLPVFERVQIYDAGAEGKAIARVDNMVIFVPFGTGGYRGY
jgi:predicted RNA-binding protein with TRAM domain